MGKGEIIAGKVEVWKIRVWEIGKGAIHVFKSNQIKEFIPESQL